MHARRIVKGLSIALTAIAQSIPVRQPLRQGGSKGSAVGRLEFRRTRRRRILFYLLPLSPAVRGKGVGAVVFPGHLESAEQRAANGGAGEPTEGFIIVHDKTLKMNMRER